MTGTDGDRGGTFGNSGVRVNQQDQAHGRRKGPLQGVFGERTYEEVLEVLARNGGSL